jgi:phosphotransferase system HPr (HPr) family protein
MQAITAEQRREMVVRSPHGVDIRGAFLLAKWAQACAADILLEHDGYFADGKNLLAILRLGVLDGGRITVTVRGADAPAALAGLEALFSAPGPAVFAPVAVSDGGAHGSSG